MRTVEEALAPIAEFLKGKPLADIRENPPVKGIERYEKPLPGVDRMTNLRFDIEYVPESADEIAVLSDRAVDSIMGLLILDLNDLVVNGDVNNIQDALLKTMDGSKKRGKEIKQIQFPGFCIFQEFKPNRGTIKYTFFTAPYIEWE